MLTNFYPLHPAGGMGTLYFPVSPVTGLGYTAGSHGWVLASEIGKKWYAPLLLPRKVTIITQTDHDF